MVLTVWLAQVETVHTDPSSVPGRNSGARQRVRWGRSTFYVPKGHRDGVDRQWQREFGRATCFDQRDEVLCLRGDRDQAEVLGSSTTPGLAVSLLAVETFVRVTWRSPWAMCGPSRAIMAAFAM